MKDKNNKDSFDKILANRKRLRFVFFTLISASLFFILVFFASFLFSDDNKTDEQFIQLNDEDAKATKANIYNSTIYGTDEKNNKYKIFAEKSSQEFNTPDIKTLENLSADSILEDKRINISAKDGVLLENEKMLSLKNDIKVKVANNSEKELFDIKMDDANFSFSDNNIVGEKNILATGNNFNATSQKIKIDNENNILSFEGDVEIVFEEK